MLFYKLDEPKKTLMKKSVKDDANIQNKLKNMNEIKINILFNNNMFKVIGNNKLLMEYNFNKNINNISNAKIFDLSKNNNFIDLNL